MIRYWYDADTDDYGSSSNQLEADAFIALGYRELDRIEFDEAMRALK
jgi:hypothetical protein